MTSRVPGASRIVYWAHTEEYPSGIRGTTARLPRLEA